MILRRLTSILTALTFAAPIVSPVYAAAPALPPDARRVLMAPIAEDDAVIRARLVKVLKDRRKSFQKERKRLDDFDNRLNRGNFGKYKKEKYYSIDVPPSPSDPENARYRSLNAALQEWNNVLTSEEQFYLTIIEDGRSQTWENVSLFVQYSAVHSEELGYAYDAAYREWKALEPLETQNVSPLIKEFARQEISANAGILAAARHRQETIYLILDTLQQGSPEDHIARFSAWEQQGQRAAVQRAVTQSQVARDVARGLGIGLMVVLGIGIANGAGGGGGRDSDYNEAKKRCELLNGFWTGQSCRLPEPLMRVPGQ